MTIKIYARDCDLREVDKNEEINFLEANHNQGQANSILAYGLFHKDTLVKLMTFGRPRFNKFYSWEIIRDCTKEDYDVVGGTSKIWNHFIKNNQVHSCICYSYPHNKELFTTKYIEHCSFKNLSKAKPAKKIYFEGVWNGELKRIDKSILEMHGVDRLLKGSFGHDRTNEQILLDLGFERKEEDGYSPQVDSYFTGGLVYKITDLDTGKFYIGETVKPEEFINGNYNGSGRKWSEYFEEYKDSHKFKREVLEDNFETPKDLYIFEMEEIRKYCKKLDENKYVVDESTGCMNKKTCLQSELPICPECGAVLYHHKKTCSQYKAPDPCPECGAIGSHKMTCSQAIICPECGGGGGQHRKDCSKYVEKEACPECGSTNPGSHKKSCSHYKPPATTTCPYCGTPAGGHHKKSCPNFSENICPECGGKNSQHKKSCSQYKTRKTCPECGSSTIHLKTCSHYKEIASCPECGGIDGKHKRTCSKFKATICPECGGRSGRHKATCSRAKFCEECGELSPNHKQYCSKYSSKTCPECGGKRGSHKSNCSKAKKCEICGSPIGHHTPECPLNKRCSECGSLNGQHKKTCSHATVCPECGGMKGQHTKECSHSKVCPECGYSAQSRTHAKTCSHYKERNTRQPCPECGSKGSAHKPFCSKYKPPKICEECGCSTKRHKSTCSHYKAPKPCPECGVVRGHKKTCSKYKRNLGSK